MANAINFNDVEAILETFKALSCKTRFDIVLQLIKHEECTVGKISEILKIRQPNISQHLSILKNAKIIEGYRNGTQICYRVVNEQAKRIIKAVESTY